MDTDHIQEFLVLQEVGSFVKASELLGISQSTLSRHIQALEAEFGEQLIDRGSHTFRVTMAGNRFAVYADKVMEAQRTLLSGKENGHLPTNDFLNISIVSGAENYGIYELVEKFHRNAPDIKLNVRNEPGSMLNHNLNIGVNDIVFTWDLGNLSPNQGAMPYKTDRFVLHIPQKHPLYGKRQVNLRELQNEPIYIRCVQFSRMFNVIKQKCREHRFDLNLYPEPGYWMSASDQVLYLTMSSQIQRIRHNGPFEIAEIEPALFLNLEIRYRYANLSPVAKKFLAYVSPHKCSDE